MYATRVLGSVHKVVLDSRSEVLLTVLISELDRLAKERRGGRGLRDLDADERLALAKEACKLAPSLFQALIRRTKELEALVAVLARTAIVTPLDERVSMTVEVGHDLPPQPLRSSAIATHGPPARPRPNVGGLIAS
jgi:hypothetical protein